MTGFRKIGLLLPLAPCLLGSPASAQVVTDFSDARFAYSLAVRRVEVLVAARLGVALRLVEVAGEVVSGRHGAAGRTTLLGEAQALADSLERYEAELQDAAGQEEKARLGLVPVLEAQAVAARSAAGAGVEATERAAWEATARRLEDELAGLRGGRSAVERPHPLAGYGAAVAALAEVVAEERARLGRLQAIQDELRVFLGYLRVFDETGMPPSARAESGGSGDPGCPVTACATDAVGLPGDLGLEHAQQAGERPGEGASAVTLTPASLDRLHARLVAHSSGEGTLSPGPGRPGRTVMRETGVALGLVGFRRQGKTSSGMTLRAAGGLHRVRSLGARGQVVLEPWVGVRSLRLDPGSATEMAAEFRETLSGSLDRGLGWQATSWQKGRTLSDPLPLPAYLEPGRMEGGVAARLSIPLRPSWALEVGGGGDGVRYGAEEWKRLDRRGFHGVMAATRASASTSARVTLSAARHAYPHEGDPRRADTRLSVGADWSAEGSSVVRLSLGLTSNDSRLPAYDYRSGRGAVALSVPWGAGSLQALGALAVQRYANPGSEGRRVAPSDQDTGSLLALQLTRPWGSARALTLRAEWARSMTGFGSDLYHRFSASVQIAFRGLTER
jgi:hypothetical protein